jgi:hypothetical protein
LTPTAPRVPIIVAARADPRATMALLPKARHKLGESVKSLMYQRREKPVQDPDLDSLKEYTRSTKRGMNRKNMVMKNTTREKEDLRFIPAPPDQSPWLPWQQAWRRCPLHGNPRVCLCHWPAATEAPLWW